ncbi:MAG: NAD-dependent succinate-semialdehyde dehydrogenase [Chlamydiota bacterium]
MVSLEKYVLQEEFASFINGQQVAKSSGEPIEQVSPLTKKMWKTVLPAGVGETGFAVSSAQQAFKQWSKTPSPLRAKVLRDIANLLMEHKELLANTITLEMGKPIKESHAEIVYSASYFSWFAGEAERIYGTSIPSQFPNKSLKIIHEPVGVCGFITPWNFPIAMPARKVAAALAAGCTTIIKPSPETPISMFLLAKICQIAGVPDGSVNVVVGPEKEIGNIFLDSPVVRKISFTGSTQVGMYLYRRSADTMKKLTLELGGHAPLIVFDDASIEKAIEGTIIAKFRNTGQTCVCANRIFVQEGIYDQFLEAFVSAVERLKVGDPLDENTDLSIFIHESAQVKVKDHVEDALVKGAEAVLMSEQPYEPKILTGINPSMKIFTEETFGPVAPIMKFCSVDEGITLANASEFGLASYVFTNSMECANTAVSRLEYGIIGVNDGLVSTAQASFGGMKNSGLGREGGPTGIDEYLLEKYVSIAF